MTSTWTKRDEFEKLGAESESARITPGLLTVPELEEVRAPSQRIMTLRLSPRNMLKEPTLVRLVAFRLPESRLVRPHRLPSWTSWSL